MEFQTDYIFAWDFSDKDAPVVSAARLRAEGKHLVYDVISVVSKESGVVSLRQTLDEYERTHREEKNNELYSDDRQHISESG